ncbi:2Fe-2S iron-sulfur cluster protein [Hoeflea marina]|uniref:2Fe-2S iron-sulfur cluster protein n=1 Tax=Hoeflea marina TaxID=274592 RepID=A0A317PSZ5_9HYPH|nr:(2Fe-2S)-binding protein [Hoeflea marina]PWW01944.1 2Fe-2S iron-sulfur cluster protein [Hoeflea marina]
MNKLTTSFSAPFPLFRPIGDEPAEILLELDGKPLAARATDTVASLLLRHIAPETYRHSAVAGEPRAPLCLMGVCFECLIEIDGQKNQQGCLVRVRDGMRVRRQIREGGCDEQA